jgi:hypothetical protein
MPSSPAPRPAFQPAAQQRQQWEVAVLTARLPAQAASLVIAILLTPHLSETYAPRPWEPMERFAAPLMRAALVEHLRRLLVDELRQARRLVWTPLEDLCRLERNAPLAVHAARLAQVYWELAHRPGVQASAVVGQALEALAA